MGRTDSREPSEPEGTPGDELTIGTDLVRALLREQAPRWADLPLTTIRHYGTEHAMLRLGDDLTVRLPRVAWAARTLQVEQTWLPRIAGHLPVDTPLPVTLGRPSAAYPWPWTVCRWVPGTNPVADGLADPIGLAGDLAALALAMRALDPHHAPPTVWPAPLHEEDRRVRSQLPALADVVDVTAVARAWEDAIGAELCPRRTWIHGDLAAGNLLLRDNRLCGVIDFSAMGLGDPASDLRPAWNLLPASVRPVLREAAGADAAQWSRARGWALLQAVAQLARFRVRNEWLAATALRTLSEIADEVRSGRL